MMINTTTITNNNNNNNRTRTDGTREHDTYYSLKVKVKRKPLQERKRHANNYKITTRAHIAYY